MLAGSQVSGPAGATVTIRAAELLFPNGTVNNQLSSHTKMTTNYTLRGGGLETYQPQWVYYGFQFLEVTGLPGKPTDATVRQVALHSDVQPVSQLSFDDGPVGTLLER